MCVQVYSNLLTSSFSECINYVNAYIVKICAVKHACKGWSGRIMKDEGAEQKSK